MPTRSLQPGSADPGAERRELFALHAKKAGAGGRGRTGMVGLGGDLTPPYTSRRSLEGIEEFLAYGVDILGVESFSHCWEGPGGVLAMADHAEEHGKKGPMKWLAPSATTRSWSRSCSRCACT